MERTPERAALFAAILSLLLAVAAAAGRTAGGSFLLVPMAALHAWAGLVALAVASREFFARRAAEEALEMEAARREQPDSSLFARVGDAADEPFSMARSAALFERWAVPAVAPLLGLGLGAAAWMQGRALAAFPPFEAASRLPAAGWFGATALALLVLGRYLVAHSRAQGRSRVRAAGVAAGATALAGLAAAAACLATGAGYPAVERVVATALVAAAGLLGAEQILNALLDLYRPRGADAEASSPYESRIARRLCDPSAWMRGAAESLDYQFGFKVSQTWLAGFLGRTLAPLLLFQIAVLYALTSVAVLGPEEEGILERLGRPRSAAAGGWHLAPGFHWKLPWPFETVRRVPARRLLETHVGYEGRVTNPDETLWTRPHFEREDPFLTAARDGATSAVPSAGDAAVPVNLVSVNLPVEYRVTNLLQYAYGHRDPAAALRAAATRAVTRETAGRDLFDVLGAGQAAFARAVGDRIRADAAAMGLGVEVTFVGVQGVHPPVPIADAFESVVGALEEKESAVLAGRAHAARVLPAAEAAAQKIGYEAQARRAEQELGSRAEAEQFVIRKAAHDRSPAVYRGRAHLQAVQDALVKPRLFVVAAPSDTEVLQLNLEEKIPSSLFDPGAIPVAPAGGAGAGTENRK